MESSNIENSLVTNCLVLSRQLIDSDFEICLQWTPSHVGIRGNEIVDKIAKEATQLPDITILSPCYTDIKNLIRRKNNTILQTNWQAIKANEFLGSNKPVWGPRTYENKTNRKTEVMINRLRVGKTLLNKHAFRINISTTPNCIYCNTDETIEHFFFILP